MARQAAPRQTQAAWARSPERPARRSPRVWLPLASARSRRRRPVVARCPPPGRERLRSRAPRPGSPGESPSVFSAGGRMELSSPAGAWPGLEPLDRRRLAKPPVRRRSASCWQRFRPGDPRHARAEPGQCPRARQPPGKPGTPRQRPRPSLVSPISKIPRSPLKLVRPARLRPPSIRPLASFCCGALPRSLLVHVCAAGCPDRLPPRLGYDRGRTGCQKGAIPACSRSATTIRSGARPRSSPSC